VSKGALGLLEMARHRHFSLDGSVRKSKRENAIKAQSGEEKKIPLFPHYFDSF